MAIPQPNLDDRTYDQLVAEGRALIARHCPAWTDYNPSDPGITLLELFAYLAEAAIYQINRIPERSLERYALLVGVARNPGEPIAQTLARAAAALGQRSRAITDDDFEALLLNSNLKIARCRTVAMTLPAPPPNGIGAATSPQFFPADSLVKIIIVPADPAADVGALCKQAYELLMPRTLIATRIAVTPPDYTAVQLTITVVRTVDSRLGVSALTTGVTTSVTTYFDDRKGGLDGAGWPFGRPVYRSDLYRLIEDLDGVDHVAQLLMHDDASPEDDASREAISLVSSLSLVRLAGLAIAVI
jgi:hypothetical protein